MPTLSKPYLTIIAPYIPFCQQMTGCNRDKLVINGPWKVWPMSEGLQICTRTLKSRPMPSCQWLIEEFASRFSVSAPYTLMAHLRWILSPSIVSMTAHCYRMIGHLMSPLLKFEDDGRFSREEVSALLHRTLQYIHAFFVEVVPFNTSTSFHTSIQCDCTGDYIPRAEASSPGTTTVII